MTAGTTRMRRRACEIPAAVEHLLSREGDAAAATLAGARDMTPTFPLSVARGSAGLACTCPEHASELLAKPPMTSAGPPVASQFGLESVTCGTMCMSISQSGHSPDILHMTKAPRENGALTITTAKNPESRVAGHTRPIHAGPGLSVAGKRTSATTPVAGLRPVAEELGQASPLSTIQSLPDHPETAIRCHRPPAQDAVGGRSLLTFGREPSRAISNEAAPKFKKACLVHAKS